MSRLSKEGLNVAIEGDLGTSALFNQSFLIQANNPLTRKHLSVVRAALTQPFAGTYNQQDRIARLIICTGGVPQTSDEPSLSFTPFGQTQPGINGIDRILYSTVFVNEIEVLFDPELIVIEGQTLNILLGTCWTQGDTVTTASQSYGYLAAIGREVLDGQDNFAWKMV